jgi:hypothetical protein
MICVKILPHPAHRFFDRMHQLFPQSSAHFDEFAWFLVPSEKLRHFSPGIFDLCASISRQLHGKKAMRCILWDSWALKLHKRHAFAFEPSLILCQCTLPGKWLPLWLFISNK